MGVVIGLALFFIVVIGAVVGFIFYYNKKIQQDVNDPNNTEDEGTTEDFLPFKDFITVIPGKFAIVDLGNGEYRAYIQVGSVNYKLMSDREQNVFEVEFRRLLNTIPFSWEWYVQTHNVDNKLRMKYLDDDVTKTLQDFRNTTAFQRIRDYYTAYKYTLKKIHDQNVANGHVQKEKRKYIIIPFNANTLDPNLSDDQAAQEVIRRISVRVDQMISCLSDANLPAHYLSYGEIIVLYVSAYNRDNNLYSKSIANGDFTSVYADNPGSDYLNQLTDPNKLEIVLDQARNKLGNDLIRLRNVDPDTRKKAKEISDYLAKEMQAVRSM